MSCIKHLQVDKKNDNSLNISGYQGYFILSFLIVAVDFICLSVYL